MNRHIRYCADSPNPAKAELQAEIDQQLAEYKGRIQQIPMGVGVLSAGVKPYSINLNGAAKSNSKRPQGDENN